MQVKETAPIHLSVRSLNHDLILVPAQCLFIAVGQRSFL